MPVSHHKERVLDFFNFRTVDNPKVGIIASCSKLGFESVSFF